MGKSPKQIALNCFAKIKDFTLEESDFLAGAGLILRPSEEMVNTTVDEIVNYPHPKGCALLVFASTKLLMHNRHIASFAQW